MSCQPHRVTSGQWNSEVVGRNMSNVCAHNQVLEAMFYDVMLCYTLFYIICIRLPLLRWTVSLSLLLWNLSDQKGKFSCHAFIMNNKVPVYLLYCGNKNICKVQTSTIKELVVQKSNLTTRLKHCRWKTTRRITSNLNYRKPNRKTYTAPTHTKRSKLK